MTAAAPRPRSLLPLAELSLLMVTLAAIATFWRLFDDRSFLPPLVLLAVAAHVVVLTCRRLSLGLPSSAVVTAAAAALVHTWVLYPSTASYALPTSRTLDAVGDDLGEAWELFFEIAPPTPAVTGYLVAAGLAIWIAAFIADWAAFRLWVPIEAIVPAGTLWLFASMLGSDNSRAQAALLFGGAVLVFILLHRTVRQQVSATWLVADADRGSHALLRVGGWLLAGSLVAAAIVGPLLPGARADAWVDWREWGDGRAGRTTFSPLVQVRGQLLERTNVELFTVESSARSYWRLTSLEIFDGEQWRSSGSYRDVGRGLPPGNEAAVDVTPVRQTFHILTLDALWLPAAFEARSFISLDGEVDARWDPESSTLIVDTDIPDSDGARYMVESAVPVEFTALELSRAGGTVPTEIAERYLELPRGFSDRIEDLATEVTAGETSPYDKARALQDYLRQNFQYDTAGIDVDHGEDAMEAFLFDVRRGFCAQFAASFAAMARAVGLPSRVAVGFTPGEIDPDNPSLYHVRGLHGHAWPEVYIAGYGWVPFEPTPDRGIPGGQQYTGVPEQQANSLDPSTGTTVPVTQVADGSEDAVPPELTELEPDGGLDVGGGAVGAGRDRPSFVERWGPKLVLVLAVLLGLVVLYMIAVPVSHLLRRRSRRGRAATPNDQVRVAWQESVEALSVLGVERQVSETPREFASRAARVVGAGRSEPLAEGVEAAEFSPAGATGEQGARALALSDEITAEVRKQASKEQRLRAALDPRPVHRAHSRRDWLARDRARQEGPELELVDRH